MEAKEEHEAQTVCMLMTRTVVIEKGMSLCIVLVLEGLLLYLGYAWVLCGIVLRAKNL